jgi:hypothetical protein
LLHCCVFKDELLSGRGQFGLGYFNIHGTALIPFFFLRGRQFTACSAGKQFIVSRISSWLDRLGAGPLSRPSSGHACTQPNNRDCPQAVSSFSSYIDQTTVWHITVSFEKPSLAGMLISSFAPRAVATNRSGLNESTIWNAGSESL